MPHELISVQKIVIPATLNKECDFNKVTNGSSMRSFDRLFLHGV